MAAHWYTLLGTTRAALAVVPKIPRQIDARAMRAGLAASTRLDRNVARPFLTQPPHHIGKVWPPPINSK
jgi:hypothetical protein